MQREEQKQVPKQTGNEKRHWNMISFYLLLYDIAAVNIAYFFGLLLRFDFQICTVLHSCLYCFVLHLQAL